MSIARFLLVLFLLAGLFTPTESAAQRGPRAARAQAHKRQADKIHARRVIRRTAIVIRHAQKMVKQNKVYTGNLARAVAHQRFARRLFLEGKFLRAMHQARRARHFAILAIQANKGQAPEGTAFDKDDEAIMNDNPVSDADLDKDLNENMPGYSQKDEDFVDAALTEIDLGDME